MKIFSSLNKYFVSSEEMATDPVCGMKIVKSDVLKANFDGAAYYFCSENCQGQFKQNPRALIKNR